MPTFPLQEQLIDAVVEFVNTDIKTGDEARQLFAKSWATDKGYSVGYVRRVQRDTAEWLHTVAGRKGQLRFDDYRPIRLAGRLGYKAAWDGEDPATFAENITWNWWIENAPLRAVCALAVQSIYQAGIQERVGFCVRKDCGTFFIDRKSRGERRQYCGTNECEKARNRDRVAKSRGAK